MDGVLKLDPDRNIIVSGNPSPPMQGSTQVVSSVYSWSLKLDSGIRVGRLLLLFLRL